MAEAKKELYQMPTVKAPRIQDLEEISEELGFQSTDDELLEFKEIMIKHLGDYSTLDRMVSPKLPVKYPRTPGYRPKPEENKLNAWYHRCDIQGAPSGPLEGKRVAVKDNICVAGVNMMNGSKFMENFVPDEDATVVTRILDAGGRIVGKTSCENMCFSGSSWTNDVAPTLNPYDTERTTGGSSGGSAAVVQQGEADMALGGDQGGSIRIPASWCGIVGLKPTWGLVPYTGAVSIEVTCDHLGPMARTVQDCALLLEAIAGYDNGLDPRQPRDLQVPQYTKLLTGDLRGQKVGLLAQGFDGCDEEVNAVVMETAHKLVGAGAVVEEVSVPFHKDGNAIWGPICLLGAYKCMIRGNGFGYHYKGHYSEAVLTKLQDGYRSKGRNTSDPLKLTCFMGGYIDKNYGNKFYAKAQNVLPVLTQAYDDALDRYDVLVMPTLPYKAPRLPKADMSITDRVDNALGMVKNTGQFDVTGHPALSINAGWVEGLPIGLMIVGKHFQEVKVLNVAYAVEKIMKK